MTSKEAKYHRIRQIIDGLEITPYAFAKRIGVAPSAVYQWLDKGGQPGYNISDQNTQKIVNAFSQYGVTTDWLKYGVGPAPDFKAEPKEAEGSDGTNAVERVLIHLDVATNALRAGRVIDAFEAIEAAREAIAA